MMMAVIGHQLSIRTPLRRFVLRRSVVDIGTFDLYDRASSSTGTVPSRSFFYVGVELYRVVSRVVCYFRRLHDDVETSRRRKKKKKK